MEATPNLFSPRKVVCHSNIAGGKQAFQAGELWFGTDDKLYINFRSGRHGAENREQRNVVLQYFNFVGYKNIVEIN